MVAPGFTGRMMPRDGPPGTPGLQSYLCEFQNSSDSWVAVTTIHAECGGENGLHRLQRMGQALLLFRREAT